jgi:glycosyltransferase involved in cell wall biosynthesis
MATAPQTGRTPWPVGDERAAASHRGNVAIVVANANTRRLIAQLVFSLYRLLGRDEFTQLVIVDNASTDGSRELLNALHADGLIHLIRNRSQRYHGPALTQGISWLARRQRTVGPGDRLDYVWVMDSDVILLRPDTVRDALASLKHVEAAAVGQIVGDPAYDQLLRNNPAMLHPCSLIFDPALIWQPPMPPFVEDGAPGTALQVAADRCGLRLAKFPFVEKRYLLHLGRGTLREVAESGNAINRYYNWALDHRDYHFSGQAEGPEVYRVFCELFDAEVGDLRPERLVEACRRSRLLTVE